MDNKMRGGALREKRLKKFFAKKHVYSGLVNWPTQPTRNRPSQRFQTAPTGDSSSCVAQSKASHVEVKLGVVASAEPIFINRKPKGYGMSLSNAGDNVYKIGTGLESLIPSQRMTDAQLDVPSTQPTPLKSTGKEIFVPIVIDQIADAINQFGGVSMVFESNESEWDASGFTPVWNGSQPTFGHCIFAFDYYSNNGVKTLICSDSDGLWSSPQGIRYITEQFLVKRSTGVSYSPGFVDTSIMVTPVNPMPQPGQFTSAFAYHRALFWYFLKKFAGH